MNEFMHKTKAFGVRSSIDHIHILNINSYYRNPMYKDLCDCLIRKNVDLRVYFFSCTTQDISGLDDYVDFKRNHNKIDRFLYFPKHRKVFSDFTNLYANKNYHIAHAHSLFSNGLISYLNFRNNGVPYIVAVRNTDMNVFFRYILILRRLGIRILTNAANIVFISECYKREIANYIPSTFRNQILNKSIVIPNGINEFWHRNEASCKAPPQNNRIRILCVGDINSNKNQILTAKACSVLIKRGYKVSYTVVGAVKSENVLKKLSSYPFVTVCARQCKEELIEHYRQSDVFVMPSKKETFGLVYAEAMSQGVPVIYTKGQGFDGQYPEGIVGYPVSCGDEIEIANRVEAILSDYERISRNCIKHSREFDWNYIADKYLDIYKCIICMEN